MKRSLISNAGWVAFALLLSVQWVQAAAHPHIHNAVVALREARTELQEAKHDFCGHRAAALKAAQDALSQLQLALQCNP